MSIIARKNCKELNIANNETFTIKEIRPTSNIIVIQDDNKKMLIKFDDFQTLTRDVTLTLATDQAAVIRQAVGECLKRVKFEKRLRLIGIRVGSLEPKNLFAQEQVLQQTSLSLFD